MDPFVRIPRNLLTNGWLRQINTPAKALFLACLELAAYEQTRVWERGQWIDLEPGQWLMHEGTLAQHVGIDRKTLKKALAELEAVGFLRLDRPHPDHNARTRFRLQEPSEFLKSKPAEEKRQQQRPAPAPAAVEAPKPEPTTTRAHARVSLGNRPSEIPGGNTPDREGAWEKSQGGSPPSGKDPNFSPRLTRAHVYTDAETETDTESLVGYTPEIARAREASNQPAFESTEPRQEQPRALPRLTLAPKHERRLTLPGYKGVANA